MPVITRSTLTPIHQPNTPLADAWHTVTTATAEVERLKGLRHELDFPSAHLDTRLDEAQASLTAALIAYNTLAG